MSEVATAYVTLMPSARGFLRNIKRQLDQPIKMTGEENGKSWGKKFTSGAKGALRGVGRVLVDSLGVGVGAVGSSILSGMVGQGVALAGALSTAAGAAGLIPAALAGGAAIIGTMAIGMQGMGDAFKAVASGDAKKLQKALKDLSPNARDFVLKLQKALPAIRGIKNAVQDNLFAGLGTVFAKALTDLGPVAKRGFSKIASGLNEGLRGTFKAIDTKGNLRNVNRTFDMIARSLHLASGAAAPLVNALVRFVSVGATFLPRLGAGFANISKQAAGFIRRITSDGSLGRWISQGLDMFKTLGGIIKNVGSILASVLGAGVAQGKSLLTSFSDATNAFASFLKTGQGQVALTLFFRSAGAAAGLLGPLIGALGPVLETVVKAIGPLAQQFGPVLVSVIQALAPGINAVVAALGPFVAALSPSLVQVAGALGQVLVALAPALVPLANLVAGIVTALLPLVPLLTAAAGALVPLLNGLTSMSGPLTYTTGGIIALFYALKGAKAAAEGIKSLKNNISDGIDAIKKFGSGVKSGFDTVRLWGMYAKDAAGSARIWMMYAREAAVSKFTGAVRSGADTVRLWGMYAKDGAVQALAWAKGLAVSSVAAVRNTAAVVASRAAQIAAAAAAKAMAAAQWILNAAMSANPIVLVVIAIAALVAGFILAYNKVGWFRAAVQAAFGAIVAAGKFMWSGFVQVFNGISAAVGWVIGFVRSNWPLLVGIMLGPIGMILGLVYRFRSQIAAAFSAAWAGVKAIFGAALAFIIWLVRGNIIAIENTLGAVSRVFSRAFSAVRGAVSSAFSSTISWVKGIPGAITSALGDLGGILKDAGIAIIGGFLNGIKQKFEDVKHFVGGIAGWIHDHKGPLTFDRQLLVPHGKAVMGGFLAGLQQGFIKVQTAIQRFTDSLATKVNVAGTANSLTSLASSILVRFKGESSTIRGINAQNLAIARLTRARTAVAGRLAKANSALVNAQQTLLQKASSVGQNILSAFNISTAGGSGSGVTFASILQDVTNQAKQAGDFRNALAKLKGLGLDKTLFDQLASAGPQAAAQVAALASASKAQIAALNTQYGLLSHFAGSIGMIDAQALYQSGVDAARGLIQGLRSQEKAIDAQMIRMGVNLVRSINKALGIRSPARKTIPTGEFTALGVVKGMRNKTKHIRKEAAVMAEAAVPKMSEPFVGPRKPGDPGDAPAGGDTFHIYESTNARQVALEIQRQRRHAGRI